MTTFDDVLAGGLAMADGGLETSLVFDDQLTLTDFAAFPLLDTADGRDHLRRYYDAYIDIAARAGIPILLDTPTWRANLDWGARLGYDPHHLAALNERAVAFLRNLTVGSGVSAGVNGVVGPRGDGYRVETTMSVDEAARYHALQAEAFAASGANSITAVTMTYCAEATGVALAARAVDLPTVISFTVETDGRLPSGQTLADAIATVDDATDAWPSFFMVNCAHPTHFEHLLDGTRWTARIGGIRANASMCSHEQLDNAEVLDRGNPAALADDYVRLRTRLPGLRLVGGCCGTNHDHLAAIVHALHPTTVGPHRR